MLVKITEIGKNDNHYDKRECIIEATVRFCKEEINYWSDNNWFYGVGTLIAGGKEEYSGICAICFHEFHYEEVEE